MEKPVKCGLDFVRDTNWRPRILTRKGAQALANRMAMAEIPHGFWKGSVCDCGSHYRISICGQTGIDRRERS